MQAFQDFYPENVAHCYGCGRLNGHGPTTQPFPASSMAACSPR